MVKENNSKRRDVLVISDRRSITRASRKCNTIDVHFSPTRSADAALLLIRLKRFTTYTSDPDSADLRIEIPKKVKAENKYGF